MFVACCASSRFCDKLTTPSEESYQVCVCVCVCVCESNVCVFVCESNVCVYLCV